MEKIIAFNILYLACGGCCGREWLRQFYCWLWCRDDRGMLGLRQGGCGD